MKILTHKIGNLLLKQVINALTGNNGKYAVQHNLISEFCLEGRTDLAHTQVQPNDYKSFTTNIISCLYSVAGVK